MMSYAIGGLNWQPSEFWAAGAHELMAAAEWHELQAKRRAEADRG